MNKNTFSITCFAFGLIILSGIPAWATENEDSFLEKTGMEFDSFAWKTPRRARSGMVGDLVRRYKIIGMSRPRIRQLLAEPLPIDLAADENGSSRYQDSYALNYPQCGNAPITYLDINYGADNVVKSFRTRTEELGSEAKFSKTITENFVPLTALSR